MVRRKKEGVKKKKKKSKQHIQNCTIYPKNCNTSNCVSKQPFFFSPNNRRDKTVSHSVMSQRARFGQGVKFISVTG